MEVLSEKADDAGGSGEPLSVVVVVGTASTRRRIAPTLEKDDPGTSVIEAGTIEELTALEISSSTIMVLVCDVDLPREMAALRRLRRETQGSPIVAISPPLTGTGVRRALDAGADAIVFEPEFESTLPVAVRAVGSGQSVVPRNFRASVERPNLSHRERQVLTHASRGLTNAQIASQLYLAESTIKSHLSSVFAKLGVQSRQEAAALFLELEPATNSSLQRSDTAATPPIEATT